MATIRAAVSEAAPFEPVVSQDDRAYALTLLEQATEAGDPRWQLIRLVAAVELRVSVSGDLWDACARAAENNDATIRWLFHWARGRRHTLARMERRVIE